MGARRLTGLFTCLLRRFLLVGFGLLLRARLLRGLILSGLFPVPGVLRRLLFRRIGLAIGLRLLLASALPVHLVLM